MSQLQRNETRIALSNLANNPLMWNIG